MNARRKEGAPRHLTPAAALGRLAELANGQDWRVLLRRGELEAGIYAPRGQDHQEPHEEDELYIVVSGQGWFRNGEERHRFGPGDMMFVPAGTKHGFEDFGDDFATWAILFPAAGDAAA